VNEHLISEIHGLTADGTTVITVQHWRPGTLITFRNGRQAGRIERSTTAATARRFAKAKAALEPIKLTDDQAQAKLRELTGEEPYTCPSQSCGDRLPIGGYRCAWCGTSPARRAAGLLSGANRRPAIFFRTPAN
jgi:hypothetical protein